MTPSRPDSLPDAELEVLACLWRSSPATVREVREALASWRPLTHGSVTTLLGRLEEKGWVKRAKGPVGKAFIYAPAKQPGPLLRRVLGDLVERVFGGDPVQLVSSLFQGRPPSADELDELQGLLDGLRAGKQQRRARERQGDER